MFPEELETALEVYEQIADADLGVTRIELSLPDGMPVVVTAIGAGDADQLLAGVVAGMEELGDLSARLIKDPKGSIALDVEEDEVEGVSCYRAGLRFIEGTSPVTGSAGDIKEALDNVADLLLASSDGSLVVGSESEATPGWPPCQEKPAAISSPTPPRPPWPVWATVRSWRCSRSPRARGR